MGTQFLDILLFSIMFFYFICIIYNIILIFELTNNFINNKTKQIMTQFKFYVDWQDDRLRRSYFLVDANCLGDALNIADMLMTEPGIDQYNNQEFSYPILFGSPVFIGLN